MGEYTLHISDMNAYSADLNEIRKKREQFMVAEENKITLVWSQDDITEQLAIYVIGPNLWVDSFDCSGGNRLRFEEVESKQNYQPKDNPGMIDTYQMTAALSSFVHAFGEILEWKTMAVCKTPEINSLLATKLRNTYLICIFLASEVVRNEFFELIYCKKSGCVSWKDCKVLFQNWKSIARLVYPEERKNELIPVVRWDDWSKKINEMSFEIKRALGNIIPKIK